jgi:hypothetical protein
MVELGSKGTQAAFYITKAFSVRPLRKGHASMLIRTGKRTDALIALAAVDALAEWFLWEIMHDLRKNSLALIHFKPSLGRQMPSGEGINPIRPNSNRFL